MMRIETMTQSLKDDNQLYKLDHIIDWFTKKREQSDMTVEEIGINELEKWSVNSKTGNIAHETGGFFEIIGVRATNTFDREVGKKRMDTTYDWKKSRWYTWLVNEKNQWDTTLPTTSKGRTWQYW